MATQRCARSLCLFRFADCIDEKGILNPSLAFFNDIFVEIRGDVAPQLAVRSTPQLR